MQPKPPRLYLEFATTLRQLMEAAHMNGAELGRRIDKDKSVVSRWLRGMDRPEPATVARIADVFEVDQMAMLQLAEWLPGRREPIDPARASLILLARDEVPDEDLTTALRLLRGLRATADDSVPPTRRVSNGRRDGASNRRREADREKVEGQPTLGEIDPHSGVSTVYKRRRYANFIGHVNLKGLIPLHGGLSPATAG